MIAADAARTTISMFRTPPTLPFAGRRTVTPRSRDGMVDSLRVLAR